MYCTTRARLVGSLSGYSNSSARLVDRLFPVGRCGQAMPAPRNGVHLPAITLSTKATQTSSSSCRPAAGTFGQCRGVSHPNPPGNCGLSSQISETIKAGRHGLRLVDYQARPLGLVSYTAVPWVNLFLAKRGLTDVADDLLDAVESRGVLRVWAYQQRKPWNLVTRTGKSTPCSDFGRGPTMRRWASPIAPSLMVASRRHHLAVRANSHSSLP